jgi:hypothetical protein
VFLVTVFTALLGSVYQRRTFPILGSISSHIMASGPRYISSVRTAQKTPPPTALFLLRVCLLLLLPRNGCVAEFFHSNGCLCWLHSSGFQQTCHVILIYIIIICICTHIFLGYSADAGEIVIFVQVALFF